MLILAIDTATPWGTVALAEDGQLIFEASLKVAKGGGEALLAILERLFQKADRRMEELTLIAAGLGPGSYTGIRVGLAMVAGLAEGLNIPVFGVNTLRLIAENARFSAPWVAVALDARRGEVYGALYRVAGTELQEVLRPQALKAEVLAAAMADCPAVMLCGDGGMRYPALFAGVPGLILAPERWNRPAAALAAEIARAQWRPDFEKAASFLAPEYMKRVEAEIRLEEKSGGANHSCTDVCGRS